MNKKIKNLIWCFVGILSLVGIIALIVIGGNSSDSEKKYSASTLSAVENSFNFNTISMEDGDVVHSFKVKNEGAESVRIKKVYTSCMCTVANIIDSSGQEYGKFGMLGHGGISMVNIEVMSGETVIVEATFNPAAHGPQGVGKVKRIIYLETNSQMKPKIQLAFEANVIN